MPAITFVKLEFLVIQYELSVSGIISSLRLTDLKLVIVCVAWNILTLRVALLYCRDSLIPGVETLINY